MKHQISRRTLGLGIAGGVALFLSRTVMAQRMLPIAAPVELTPLKNRLSDLQIGMDLDKLVQLHLRIDRLNTAGNQQAVYTQAQAYTWLEAARIEYLDNNETGWESYAFNKAKTLVEGAERQQYPQIQAAAAINRYFANATQKWNANKDYLSNNAAALGRQSVLLEWAAYEEQNDPNFVNTDRKSVV